MLSKGKCFRSGRKVKTFSVDEEKGIHVSGSCILSEDCPRLSPHRQAKYSEEDDCHSLFSCPLGAEAVLCKTDAEKAARTRFSRAAARRTPWLTRLPAPGPVKNPVESQSRKRGALYAHSHGH